MINFELKKESYSNYSAVYSEPSTIRWHGYNAGWSDCESTYLKRLDELEKKNEELKKALSFYADKNNWDYLNQNTRTMMKNDFDLNVNFSDKFGGKRARLALKGSED
jgi:hypothetical protein